MVSEIVWMVVIMATSDHAIDQDQASKRARKTYQTPVLHQFVQVAVLKQISTEIQQYI